MNKLTLEQLAPYLPYSPKVQTEDGIYDVCGWSDDIGIMLNTIDYGFNAVPACKLVLRPMADLNQSELMEIVDHIFRDSKGVMPQLNSVKFDRGYITFYDLNTMQNYVAVKPSSDGTPLLNMSNCFQDYKVFFKLNVDMSCLIEKGLAISIHDLKEV